MKFRHRCSLTSMNGPGDIPLTHSSGTPDTRPCSLISIIPTLGMSSCRGRAEAFARRLSSKLRTLGSQTDNDAISPEDEPIINGGSTNTWITTQDESGHTVTNLQPLRHESDSFFDFDLELESPGSPVDECEYLRLIETASNTPHNSAPESGYACTSAASSHSSTDGPYFDASNKITSTSIENHAIITKQPTSPKFSEPSDPTEPIALRDTMPADVMKSNSNAESCNNCSGNGTNNHLSSETLQSPKVHNSPVEENEINIEFRDFEQHSETKRSSEGSDFDSGLSESVVSNDGLLSMQDKIIKELQRESQELSNATENDKTATSECEETPPPDRDEATIATTINDSKDVVDSAAPASTCLSIITNGHIENGDELLQIKVTEVEKTETVKEAESLCEPPLVVASETIEPAVQSPTAVEESKPTSKDRAHLSTADTTDDEDDCRPQRVRRCSSLKTGKTPPGTPGRKKIVRFADVLGLDLADIKTFLDEIPTIPKSAFEDLEILDSEPPIQLGPKSDRLLMPLFQQPGGLTTFLDLVREKQVSLENAAVTDHINQTITGSVRVRNLDFHKSVHIRYTLDNWRSFADLQANYVQNSCDGFSDIFTFILFGNTLQIGQRLEFAVRFQCKGQQFWDNNYGTNYCFQCLPSTSPVANPIQPIVASHHVNNMSGMLSPTAGDAWCSSFY